MTFKLYQHQKDLCRKIVDHIESPNVNRAILEAPTGAGKTVISAALLDCFTNYKQQKVMFFVNRIELIEQSIDKFTNIKDKLSVIKAGAEYAKLYDSDKPCQLTMIQTFYARRDSISFVPDIIIVDEIHDGYGSGRMNAILEMYPNAKLIGLTATPINEKGMLLKGFDAHVRSVQVKDLQQMINPQNGLPFLAKDINYVPKVHDYSHIKIRGSDYDQEELAEEVSQDYLIENIVDLHKDKFKYLKTLVFCVNIKHSEILNQEFRKAGYTSAVIHSKMKNSARKAILKMHKEGRIDILLNVGILTTGYDDSSLECIILAYPTKSLRKFIQMIGRGARVQAGKTEFVVIDFGSNIKTHGSWSEERHYLKNAMTRKSVFEPILCPGCFMVIEERVSKCPDCGFSLKAQVEEREVQEKEFKEAQELIRIEEVKYKNETSIELLRELFAAKNEKQDVSLFFYKHIYMLKPEAVSEDYFNKRLQPIIKQATRGNYKIWFVVMRIKDKLKEIAA